MTGTTFGRKGAAIANAPDLAARRAAFLAAERARSHGIERRGGERREPERSFTFAATSAPPVYAPQKKTKTAYLFWFFLGGFSAHRFYLGFPVSATIQLMLTPLGYAMVLSKSVAGLVILIGRGGWLLADAVLIPGLVRRANERSAGTVDPAIFA